MAEKSGSRPPLWARNNARKVIELIDGTPAYVSLLKVKPRAGQTVRKPAAEALFKRYLRGMQAEGRVLVTGDRVFIAPCLGTLFVTDGGEIERNVLFTKIQYTVRRSGVVTQVTPFMNIPHHAFGRLFERDLRPPADVARAIVSKNFIETVLQLHALGDPNAPANSFAIRFLDGFLTGTVREFIAGTESVDTKVLDVRTFLSAKDKPEWVISTTDAPYTLFEYTDRRAQNAGLDEFADRIEGLGKPLLLGAPPSILKA
jgi:hypothetical protein